MGIHPTAVVAASASLGAGVRVGPFAVIEDDVVLGDGCVVGPHAVIHPYTLLGEGCRVHAGAVLGDVPQDVNFDNERSYVRIGDRCIIREGVTVSRGTGVDSETRVGDDCFLMAHSHLGHNVVLGNQVIITNGALLAGHVQVGDRARIGGHCMVHQFTRIGRLSMMSGGSVTTMDVPPFCITGTMSVNTVMDLNVVGLRRAGFADDQRRTLKQAFRILYRSGLDHSSAVERLVGDFECSHVHELAGFVRSSRRGICKLFRETDGGSSTKSKLAA